MVESTLDRTQQRIIGVLIEKELSVPDSYPLTESALLAGCNQKSNRDPEMSLEDFEVDGALRALRHAEWVVRVEGNRANRFRHKAAERCQVDDREKAVLAELLVRGPQAPGALKARVARLGFTATPAEIGDVLAELAARPTPLVEQLPRRPRERDQRWGHCLGPRVDDSDSDRDQVGDAVEAVAATPPAAMSTGEGLEARVARLEQDVTDLATQLTELRRRMSE